MDDAIYKHQRSIVIYWPLFLFIIISCSRSLENLKEPDFLLDNDIESDVSLDNKIFKPGKIFSYKVKIFDSLGRELILGMKPSFGEPDWELFPIDRVNKAGKTYFIDQVKLSVFKGQGGIELGKTQTIIKYDFLQEGKRVYLGEKTGVVEDSSRIFLHPPRSNFFLVNQFNPFPYVKFPIDKFEYWEFDFVIPEHALSITKDLNETSMKISYKLVGVEEYFGLIGICSVFKIYGRGYNKEIETSTTFYFNEKYGFVKIVFKTITGINVVFELEA